MTVRYTLVSEGSSDRALLHVINWTLRRLGVDSFSGVWADLRRAPSPPRTLVAKIAGALDLYPCDVLLVHRDADSDGRMARHIEIMQAAAGASGAWVPIIPIRMTEAWLLFDESAIRAAAGKPHGVVPLGLPGGARAEDIANPKQLLDDAIVRAADATGRRLGFLRRELPHRRYRVAELIDDYTPLEQLPGYRVFRDELGAWLHGRNTAARRRCESAPAWPQHPSLTALTPASRRASLAVTPNQSSIKRIRRQVEAVGPTRRAIRAERHAVEVRRVAQRREHRATKARGERNSSGGAVVVAQVEVKVGHGTDFQEALHGYSSGAIGCIGSPS